MLVAKRELEYSHIEEKRKKNIRTTNKKKNNMAVYRLMLMFFAIIGLALSLIILHRYAQITKLKLEITELQAQKIRLEEEKDDLLAELEAIKSSTKIEEDAFTKLGMIYPEEGQVVYVEVEEPIITSENETEDFNLIAVIKNVVNFTLSLFKGV
ncbi:MAG: hypothetical protein GX069_08000 [Tissierellia bacterium]|nr:hypothetical protein [Tissierellia bacterium]